MNIIRKILLALLALTLAGAATAAGREEKVVYHITDSANATMALNNVRNHLKARPNVKIVVVALGPGVDFLLDGAKNQNGNPYEPVVQELVMRNKVDFRVCNNTLEARHIDKSRVLPEATIVPSGVAEVARLQIEEGYAYIKP